MTDSPSRDQLETELLYPDQRLVQRRRKRDEEDYRGWCEASYGVIDIGLEEFHPADVLELAPDAARRGRSDAASQMRTELEQIVCEEFPAPIAVPFFGFVEGPRSPLTRVHRLRDAWESLVRLLAAIALSEAASIGTSMAPICVREGQQQGMRKGKRRDLRSDKLSVRIGLIEGVLFRAKELNIHLEMSSLLPMDVLAEIRRLNIVRNEFSHQSTKSEKQSQEIIDEAYPVLREVLLDLREMQNIDLIRIKRVIPGNIAEVERLVGHAQSQRIREITLEKEAASLALSAFPVDGMDRVFAQIGPLTLDLSPFLYAADDETGHRTRVLIFKSQRNDEWCLECVADSTSKSSPAGPHEALLRRFEDLIESAGGQP
jgi:hypothetical protein